MTLLIKTDKHIRTHTEQSCHSQAMGTDFFKHYLRQQRLGPRPRSFWNKKTRNVFRESPPAQSHPLNPTSAFAPAQIIKHDFGYVDIIYQVSCKDMSISSGAFKALL